tara:strand:- start:13783 stop:15201 length:1419 start_codon:yes stop_codon:yes gene_type:complete
MATASEIKSSVRSIGASERSISKDLSEVIKSLTEGKESAAISEFEQKEIGKAFDTAAAFGETVDSTWSLLEQKGELESNIKFFEESLPDSVKKAGGLRKETVKQPSFWNVLKGDASLSEVAFQRSQGDERYFLGDNPLGSKYDVSALGERARALQSDDTLGVFDFGDELPESNISRTLPSMPSLDVDFSKIYGKNIDEGTSIKDGVGKPLINKDEGNTSVLPKNVVNKVGKSEIPIQSEGGPLSNIETELGGDDSLSSFLPRLSNLNVIPEDEYDPNSDRLTEQDVPSFALDPITDGETDEPYVFGQDKESNLEKLGITKKLGLKNVKGFGDVSKKYSTPERALGELDKTMKKIASIEDRSRYSDTKGGEKSYQNALKRSAKLREELKKQIKSIYNPKTGKFRSKEYKQMFEEGRYAKGDPRGVREKEGFANIGRRVNILGIETPFQSQQEIDLTSIQSYINELFPKDLASR